MQTISLRVLAKGICLHIPNRDNMYRSSTHCSALSHAKFHGCSHCWGRPATVLVCASYGLRVKMFLTVGFADGIKKSSRVFLCSTVYRRVYPNVPVYIPLGPERNLPCTYLYCVYVPVPHVSTLMTSHVVCCTSCTVKRGLHPV